MPNFEVEEVLDVRSKGKNQEFLLKWKSLNRPSWVPKNDLNCNNLLLQFEKSRGPQILGAKREPGGISYLMKFNGDQRPKVMQSSEAQKYAASIIDYLESKTIWEGIDDNSGTSAVLVAPRNDTGEVIYATKGKDGLVYFFQYPDGNVAIIPAEDATILHPKSVLKYLEDHID